MSFRFKKTSNKLFHSYQSILLKKLISKKRNIYKTCLEKLSIINSNFDANDFNLKNNHNCISNKFDKHSKFFIKNRWAYIKNPIKPKFHKELKKDWPSKNFLHPYRTENKIIDVGFQYRASNNKKRLENICKYINNFPKLKEFYQYILSEDFAIRIKEFMNIEDYMICNSITTRYGTSGGWLDFHMDGVGNNNKFPEYCGKAINIVWHIDGVNGSGNGGLCLTKNKNIIEDWPNGLIHESLQLQNSCLIYDTNYEIGNYHGYPPMNKNTFRSVITSQFLPNLK